MLIIQLCFVCSMSALNKLPGFFSAYLMHFPPLIYFYFDFWFCFHGILCYSSLVQRWQDCKSLIPTSPSRRAVWDKAAQETKEKYVFSRVWHFHVNGKLYPVFQIGVFLLALQRSLRMCLIQAPLFRNGPGQVSLLMQLSLPAEGHQTNWKK